MLHVTLDREDRTINLQYTNDQLLLYERCIHLPVCTETITRIIALDWVIEVSWIQTLPRTFSQESFSGTIPFQFT